MLRFFSKKSQDEKNKLLLEINHAILMDKKKKRNENLLNLNAIFLLRIISILGLNRSVSAQDFSLTNNQH